MIIHIDMDAFYASVEERDRPELRGQPIIVGGSADGRGVVSAASYAARKFGVHSAMPAAAAKRLCPNGIFLRPRIKYYAEISRNIREIFFRYTPLVEPLSLDEAFLDVSGCERLHGTAENIGAKIKSEIKNEIDLVASVGIASNKFLAKLASDIDKPDGFVVVGKNSVETYLAPLPVTRLWGVGKAAEKTLSKLNVFTIGDLQKLPVSTLETQFGRWGTRLWQLSRGIDSRKVVPDHTAKSISNERTFRNDISDRRILKSIMLSLTEQVARRLRDANLQTKTVTIKLRFSNFRTITRSQTLDTHTNITRELWKVAGSLLENNLPESKYAMRLIGVGVSNFEQSHDQAGQQTGLFSNPERSKLKRVDQVVDTVNKRFGPTMLKLGLGLSDKSRT